mmetsp:Transcript_54099/g.60399  ORF Transcript_54099/g.60399 Transcript_54099/m.60399 type:complete len:87 (-) Transcript_54099:740-1000(-)
MLPSLDQRRQRNRRGQGIFKAGLTQQHTNPTNQTNQYMGGKIIDNFAHFAISQHKEDESDQHGRQAKHDHHGRECVDPIPLMRDRL